MQKKYTKITSHTARPEQTCPAGIRKNSAAWAPAALVASTLLFTATEASAFLGDSLELFVAETVAHDDNVFKLSGDRDPRTAIGSSSKGDTYYTTQFGANLDMTVSRQRFIAGASLNETRYQSFSQLNFHGHDAQARWLWQAGDKWNGQLGYTEARTLASLSNVQSGTINTFAPDALTARRTFGTANYLITPSWQVTAGLAQTEQRNSETTRQINNADVASGNVDLYYISRADNKIGLSLRQENGRMPVHQQINGVAYDNSYDQHSAGIVTDWNITAKSHLLARIDQVRRTHRELGQRDWDGTTAHLTYDWRTTEAFTLTAEAQRDIGNLEETNTSLVLIKGVALRPTLVLSEKTRVSALADYSIRDYVTDPFVALGNPTRSDTVRTLGAVLSYTPLAKLLIQVTGQHQSRTSNYQFGDYKSNYISIKARYAF